MRWWLYGAVLTTGAAFSVLFTGEVWNGQDGGFGDLSVVAIIAGYRALLPMLLAAAVGAVVGSAGRWRFVLLVPAAVGATVLTAYGMPPVFSPGRWQEFGWRIGNDVIFSAGTMYAQPVPYDLAPGIFVLLVPVVVVLAAFATSATLYEGSPVVSVVILGLTIGVLSTVSFEDGAGPFFGVFLACAVALLLAAGSAGGLEGPGRAAVLAGTAVVALALLVPRLPFSDATISPGFIDWTRIGTGGTSQLDVQADVGDYLTAGRDAELFRVRSPEPLLWRAGTLDYFDGVRWEDTIEPAGDDGSETAPGVQTTSVTQSVEILNARTDVFFGAYEIVETDRPYDATRSSDSSWTLDETFDEGDTYTVRSEIPQPTGEQLRAAGDAYPAPVRRKFLQLPDGTPEAVGETAREIERRYPEATTPYDTARAVERYLVYDGGFIYNLDVSYRRADQAIEEFLGDGREGFCTQFATSMALILREEGIPARVVYGATSGEEEDDGEYVVTGANMHTWVEVYFPGVGWYPFNPTPGFSMPSEMQENAPRPPIATPSGINGLEPGNLAQRRALQDAPQDAPERQARQEERPNEEGTAPAEGRRLPAWPLFLGAALALVAAVPLAKRALVARGGPDDLYADLTGRLRDTLGPGAAPYADAPSLTPTERIMLLAGAAGAPEEPMSRFARAYSDHLYSRSGDAPGVTLAYRRALRAYGRLPFWRRTLAALNPGSLLARFGRRASAGRARLAKTVRAKARGVLQALRTRREGR